MQTLKAEYRQKHGLAPETPPATPTPSLSDLRARRAELNGLLATGLASLRQREESHDTGPQYQEELSGWLSRLCEYEGVNDQIAALRSQAAKPAPPPTPTPAPTATPPRQLGLFAGAPCTAYAGGR
ncbi:MAG: hypothetical protein FJZ90_02295 [Chloroflexi bacterium]|nr:hypothetical protein [Chloroflexota bacterium]